MTNDYDKLDAMDACVPALHWIGNRTIEQAWRDCERSDWMCWLLRRIAPNPNDQRFRLVAADMAERVWGLIPDEPARLASAWAIGAARRGDADEMRAAHAAAADAADAAAYAAASAAYADADATDAAADAADAAAYAAAAYAAYAAADAAAAYADAAARSFASRADERQAQADILRQYFSAREVGELFRRAPA